MYQALIEEFLNDNPYYRRGLTDKETSKGTCNGVSEDLMRFLQKKGIGAKVIGCTGLLKPLPRDAHRDWKQYAKERQYLWHAIVKVDDGTVIDLTGSQYGKKFAGIRIMQYIELQKEWKSFKTFAE